MNDIQHQINFINEIDQLKSVYRQTRVKSDNNRAENSAEHSWQIALTAMVLQPHIEEQVDIQRVTLMLLIHDIVEIDAGDTFAFASEEIHQQQEQIELDAAKRIFGLLPETQGQQMLTLWQEFEQAETADARYAKAIDRILPLVINMSNEGGSWKYHKVTKAQALKRNQFLQQSTPALWQYACEQIELAVKKGWLVAE